MGIIIINDSDAPGRDPNRQLNTPAGDLFEIDKRITDYLQKIKSDATVASMMAGREARIAARAAGLEPPPIDMTADIRAQVPEEMFPPVLVASNNQAFTDFEGGSGVGYIVSQAFRDAVESFDPGVHQFIPVEIRRKDGGLHDKRPFYILRVTRLLNTINVAASPDLRRVSGKPTDPVTDTTTFHIHKCEVCRPCRPDGRHGSVARCPKRSTTSSPRSVWWTFCTNATSPAGVANSTFTRVLNIGADHGS